VVTIQELHCHSKIEMTMRYSRLSNMRVQSDYYKAMEKIMQGEYAKQRSVNPPRQAPDAPTAIFWGPILALDLGGAPFRV
jgi:hypothetical protein